MIEYRLGYFARSLCGHDKDRLSMIVSEDGEMVGLCDGVHRRLANPKMKKKKHIQMMRSEKMAEAFPALIQSADADAKIKKAVLAAGERR